MTRQILVPVLVHVRAGIPSISVHRHALSYPLVSVDINHVIRINASLCEAMQNLKNKTHNPLVGGSNPFGPTSLRPLGEGYGSACQSNQLEASTLTRQRRRLSRRSLGVGGRIIKLMTYVYILESLAAEEHFYTGITDDLKARLAKHNSGAVTHTSKFRPWRIKS